MAVTALVPGTIGNMSFLGRKEASSGAASTKASANPRGPCCAPFTAVLIWAEWLAIHPLTGMGQLPVKEVRPWAEGEQEMFLGAPSHVKKTPLIPKVNSR